MTWLIEDRKAELHEILEDERVLVIGPNESYSRNWLLDSHLPHFGNQFTVPTQWYTITGGNWAVVVWLEGWEFNEIAGGIRLAVSKLTKVQREIFV